MKNRYYIRAYLRNNLGDDLFVKALCQRFPKYQFYTYGTCYNKAFNEIHNLHYKRVSRVVVLIDMILKKCFNTTIMPKIYRAKTNGMIQIGGSIFIQTNKAEEYAHTLKIYNKRPYYIIGCNIGPYYEDEFIDILNDLIFRNANLITVRDKYSYNLIKDKNKAVLAPDILFSTKKPKNNIASNSKYAIISVIDLEARESLKKYEEKYISFIIKSCKALEKNKITPVLMSFCEKEGDMKMIKKINKIINVESYSYTGDIEEALLFISNSEYIIGTRFHAIILGIALSKPTIAISYSQKTNNVLNDLNYTGDIVNIKDIDKYHVEKGILKLHNSTTQIPNLKAIKEKSNMHFNELARCLKNGK